MVVNVITCPAWCTGDDWLAGVIAHSRTIAETDRWQVHVSTVDTKEGREPTVINVEVEDGVSPAEARRLAEALLAAADLAGEETPR